MEIKYNAKILPYKDGHGTICYRIGIPTSWAKQLGFSEENRAAILEFNDDKIIIKRRNLHENIKT